MDTVENADRQQQIGVGGVALEVPDDMHRVADVRAGGLGALSGADLRPVDGPSGKALIQSVQELRIALCEIVERVIPLFASLPTGLREMHARVRVVDRRKLEDGGRP